MNYSEEFKEDIGAESKEKPLLKISGTVENIIFENSSNGYSVCEISVNGELNTLTGYMPELIEGESIAAYGEWTTHVEYGDQFRVKYYEKILPSMADDIEKYLGSGIFPGIGKKTAYEIVQRFGSATFEIIENDPNRLTEIKGLSAKKVDAIHKKFVEQRGIREIVLFFQKYGLSAGLAVKAFKAFGTSAIDIINNNPYTLVAEIDGITFESADKIALDMGMAKNSEFRIAAGIIYILQNSAFLSGHTFLPIYSLGQKVKAFLEVEYTEVESVISQLIATEKLVRETIDEYDVVYLDIFHKAEENVSEKLKELAGTIFEVNSAEIDRLIKETEDENSITLAENQVRAVKMSFETSALVITGGPGTGKTTIIRSIISVMEKMNKRVALTAPTGRAAKRMTELCGMEAKTIHRLLEITPYDEDLSKGFNRNSFNPLDCDVLIIDEMSMVDILLMNSLLNAVAKGTRVIMVGDCDQLPSVGPGNVLRDIIESDSIACIKLNEIFRQAKESMIVVNAHRINQGDFPDFGEKDNDFFIVRRNEPTSLCNTISDLCAVRLPKAYNLDSISQIQVLTPTRKGIIGVKYLNDMLQSRLNPPSPKKPEKTLNGTTYRLGDKVMQIKNNYRLEWKKIDSSECGLGVFNGDVGFITDINMKRKNLTVTYDDKTVVYDFLLLGELELAYAITVHKSQGSEFDVVIFPLFEAHRLLMSRNLLYTAITRAKGLVVLVGREDIIPYYINNNNTLGRFSGLKEKLKIY